MSLRTRLRMARFTLRSDIVDVPVRLFARSVRAETAALLEEPPGLLVDVLTGTGSVLPEYARRFPQARIVAVDLDSDILELARQRMCEAGFEGLELLADDARDMRLPACVADAVNISFGLHENNWTIRSLILGECCRILKPGGLLVVADYREARGIVRSAIFRLYLLLTEPRWVNEIFYGGLERQVEDAGFEVLKVRDDLPMTRLVLARKPDA